MKHAFLIIAHGGFDQLQVLLDLLDDPRNDIFLHVDRKAGAIPELHVSRAGLRILEERLDVRWMDVSMVRCELLLFGEARHSGPYGRYHLLSGADLPIKSNDFIHSFCDGNQEKEFVGFVPRERTMEARFDRYHFLTRRYKSGSVWVRGFRKAAESVANALLPSRTGAGEIRKGTQWVSVTDACARLLLDNEKAILRRCSHTKCPDEYFIQTWLWNSPLRERIYCTDDEFKGCLRAIDWERGGPYTWGADPSDLGALMASEALFARKFDMGRYPSIIKEICERLTKKS